MASPSAEGHGVTISPDARQGHGFPDGRIRIGNLLPLTTTAFLMIVTETMPAGVLPAMAKDLGVAPSTIGLLVSVYALASAVAAIPIVALTRRLPRRPLLIGLLFCFALANSVTALSASYALTVLARVMAGLAAGVAWPVVIGFAVRISDGRNVGKAVAVTLAGSTVAMVAGLPLGTMMGGLLGWRISYALLSVVALGIVGWVLALLPAVSGMEEEQGASIWHVARIPGLRQVLFVTLLGIIAHYALYTYIAPFAGMLRLPDGTTEALLLFGSGALIGITTVGWLADRSPFAVAVAAPVLMVLSLLALFFVRSSEIEAVMIFLWGCSFGGLPTILQSATARIAGHAHAELATAMLTTVYNIGIFGGGAFGGLILDHLGVSNILLFSVFSIAAALGIILVNARTFSTGEKTAGGVRPVKKRA